MPEGFEKLPPEIRNKIYRLCLVTDVEIVMHPEAHELEDLPSFHGLKPFLQLLQVHRKIYLEAAPIFYGENVIRIPKQAEKHATLIKYYIYIRHIFSRLDFHEVTLGQKHHIAITEHTAPDSDFAPTRPHAARWGHIHKRHYDLTVSQWAPRRKLLLDELLDAKTIKINLKYFFCPGLCCHIDRIRFDLFHQFVKRLTHINNHEGKMEMQGLMTDDERAIFRSKSHWVRFVKLPPDDA